MVQSAQAVDLCSGQPSITLSTLLAGSCHVDVDNATLSVTPDGIVEDGVSTAADAVSVSNAGYVARHSDGNDDGAIALHMDRTATAAIANSGTLTGTTDAEAYSSSESSAAHAYGHAAGIGIEGGLAATLSNSGEITAWAEADAYGDEAYAEASARGVDIHGNASGSIDNAGYIHAAADAEAEGWYTSAAGASAIGVNVDGDATSIVNSGTIHADAEAWVSGYYYPTTGYISDADTGSLVTASYSNSGMVSALAIGVRVDGELASFVNDDDIGAFADGDEATARGLDIGHAVSLANRGNIGAEAWGSDDAEASAIDIGSADALINRGNLGARAEGEDADARGIEAGYVDVLANHGTIKAEALVWGEYEGDSHASAEGIELEEGGSLVNTGIIEALAWQTDGGYAYVDADGVDFEWLGELSNSGFVSVAAGGRDSSAQGISGEYLDTFANVGRIEAEAYGWDVANASGLSVYMAGSVDNGDYIRAEAEGEEYADAAAISLYSAGSVSNSGLLTAKATSYGYDYDYGYYSEHAGAEATGLEVWSLGQSLSNSGTIVASADSDGYTGADAAALWVLGAGEGRSVLSLTNSDDTTRPVITNTGALVAEASSYENHAHAAGLRLGEGYNDYSSYLYSYMPFGTGFEVSNSGTISAEASTGYGDAEAFGAELLWQSGTSFTNAADGSISATAGANGHAAARALYGAQLADVVLQNDGSLSASASALDEYDYYDDYGFVEAAGIAVDGGALHAQIVNNGTIAADAQGVYGAEAYGMAVEMLASSAISNTGRITATATDAWSSAEAYGITVEEAANSTIANSGDIVAEAYADADSEADADAYGIAVDALYGEGIMTVVSLNDMIPSVPLGTVSTSTSSESPAASLVNSGSIVATATAIDDEAEAYGIALEYMGGNAGVVNSGTITATATATDDSAEAYGIEVEEGMSDLTSIVNSGTIAVAATAGYSSADAYGMRAGEMYGEALLKNEGTISVVARATGNHGDESSADAYGMRASYVTDIASLHNSGTVSAQAEAAGDTEAEAYGLRASYMESLGRLDNSGLVVATARQSGSRDGAAEAFSIYAGEVAGEAVIANDGTLVADAKSDGVASAYGIRIDWLGSDARVENTGTIHANGNALGQSYAVYANSGSGTVFNSGTMLAGVYLGADSEKDDSLFVRNYDGHGISLVNAGSITTLIDSPSYVGGDYTQLAGGMLGFAVRDLQHYGRIDVAGTADFSAGNALSVQVDPVHKFVAGDVLHNVIASDDLVADGFTVTDNSVFWTFAPRIEGAYVDLVVGYVAPEAAVVGSGLNISASLSGLVDYVIAEGEYGKYGTLAAALNSASTADAAADVLEHVAPVLTAGAAQAMRMAGSGAANAIGTRLAETRGAASGDVARDGAVWVKPFVGKAEQDDANGVSGYEADSDGVVVGIDANLTDAWRAGVALASATSDVESRISGVEVETTQLTVYGSYAMDERTALDLSASMGMHGYDGRRLAIDGSTALSDFDGTQLALGAQFSRSYKLGSSTTLIPSLGLQLRQATLDAYSETGAGIYNLNVQEAQEDSFLIAAKGTLEQKLGKGIFLASFGVAHDSVDVASATASLSGNGPTFVTNGIEPDALVLTGGLGYRYVTGKNLEIDASYDFEGRDGFEGQTASLRFKLPF